MDKKQIVWILVRLIGVFLLYQAVFATVNLGYFMVLFFLSHQPGATLGLFSQQLLITAIYAVGAVYLLSDGRWLFRLVNSEHDDTDKTDS